MKEILKRYKQQHILNILDNTETDHTQLLNQLKHIDFELLFKIIDQRNLATSATKEITPIKGYKIDNEDEMFEAGLQLIKAGKVAVVLMAGGQGTRLGHVGPKGTFSIGLPSGKTLFHLQCDKLKRLKTLTGTPIKWYIMTSEDNHDATVKYFRSNNCFDYGESNIHFFKQDRLPLMLENKEIALLSEHSINLAANGNGGVFSSLESNGILDQMAQDGVEFVYMYGVDNALAKVADPAFIGFANEHNVDIASKSVLKQYPEEKVGVMCYKDNRPSIVEYSELDDKRRYAKDDTGQLQFCNANILQHIFKLDFLKTCSQIELPYHIAHKKVDFFKNNHLVKATQPNGFKFELFMFDVFEYGNDMAIMQVKREEEFAPVKNREGNDSPESARKMIIDLHASWQKKAGISFNITKEIDTSLSYRGENIT